MHTHYDYHILTVFTVFSNNVTKSFISKYNPKCDVYECYVLDIEIPDQTRLGLGTFNE